MKRFKIIAVLCVLAMLLAMTACTPTKNSSSSSKTSSSSSKSSSSSMASSSRQDSSMSSHDSSLDSSTVAPTFNTEHGDITSLSAEALGWGPGGPVDSEGRSEGCNLYQNKYGKYGAYFIAPSSEKIYLTFDEGYENGYTESILDTLKEKNVQATFFITMPYAKEEPDLVRRMIDEGHIVGNHSNKHKTYPSLSPSEAKEDLLALHEYVKENFGYEMSVFRFPEGNFSEQMLAVVQSCGYKSIFWSFAYRDWLTDNQPDPTTALESMISKSHPGAIYLLHAVSKTNAKVLGDFIDAMQRKDYIFSDVTQLP